MDSLGSGGPPTEIPDVGVPDLSYDEIADGTVIGQGGNADVFRVTFDWVQADAHDTAVNSVINGNVAACGAGAFVTVERLPKE